MAQIHASDKNDTNAVLSDVNDAQEDAMPAIAVQFDEPKKTVVIDERKFKHKCDDCGYETSRKNTLTTHRRETCKERRSKGLLAEPNTYCKYCFKKMRHNALRSHLRHFIKMVSTNRKPKGKHSSITKEELVAYLNSIKLK